MTKKYQAVFFDLDNTLYPDTSGLWDQIKQRMYDYIVISAGIKPEEAEETKKEIYKKYSTLGIGLVKEYGADLTDFYNYVHDIDLTPYMKPDTRVQTLLSAIRCRKYILTNADRFHVMRVLKILDILTYFDGYFDIFDTFPNSKPDDEAYRCALKISGVDDPTVCVFIDDQARNVAAAKKLGFYTIHVGDNQDHGGADLHFDRLSELLEHSFFSELI